MLLWSGQTVSAFGDAFFNLAVLWTVYTATGSAFKTAFVQLLWQLSTALFSPLAGVFADRLDRKGLLVGANLLSALAVSGAAGAVLRPELAAPALLGAVPVLNGLGAFAAAARASVLPELVGPGLLVRASGLFSVGGQVAVLLGSALAGPVLASSGPFWALMVDAGSFLGAALAVGLAPLPARRLNPGPGGRKLPLVKELAAGWEALRALPAVRELVLLGVLVNAAAFLGPLYPALVRERLGGDAAVFGLLQAAGVLGVIFGGLWAGPLEARLGAGQLLALGWGLGGLMLLGLGVSTSAPLAALFGALASFGLAVGEVSGGALLQGLTPEAYRGRVFGLGRSLSVAVIPAASVLGGFLADRLGVLPLFVGGGLWVLGMGLLAWLKPSVRTAALKGPGRP